MEVILEAINYTGRGGVGFSPPPGTFGLIGSTAGRYGFGAGILFAKCLRLRSEVSSPHYVIRFSCYYLNSSNFII